VYDNLKLSFDPNPRRAGGTAKLNTPVLKFGYNYAYDNSIWTGIEYRAYFKQGSDQFAFKEPVLGVNVDGFASLKSASTFAVQGGYKYGAYKLGIEGSYTRMKVDGTFKNYAGTTLLGTVKGTLNMRGFGYGALASYDINKNTTFGIHYDRLLRDHGIKAESLGADVSWRF